MILLSVIVPNFNHGKFITKAIDCLLAQSRPPDEIIIVDDGSTDDSAAIITAIAARDQRIRPFLREKNAGLIAVQTFALDNARGRYVYLAAADDWVEPGFFATALPMLEANPESAFFCGECCVVSGETGQRLGVRPPVRPANTAFCVTARDVPDLMHGKGHVLIGSTIVYRRDLLIEAGGLDSSLGSFADGFLARKLAFEHGFCFAPQVVATWNVFNEGLSRQTSAQRELAKNLLTLAGERIRNDGAFPPSYADEFVNLLRFSNARLALGSERMDFGLLEDMAARNAADRGILRLLFATLPQGWARKAALGWLVARFRPYSLVGLIRTKLSRRAEA